MDKRIIYINGRFLTQKSTGVHRFSYEMCKSLHKEGLNFIVLAPKNTLPDYECDFPIKIIDTPIIVNNNFFSLCLNT